LPHYKVNDEQVKIPAAWILDNLCGFKGYRSGDVGVYQNQALVIVNFGHATAEEIKKLSDNMIACVKEKTNIILECEVQMIF
jgi:UDP-N-acetylmuramate dehydrogenase